MYILKLNRNYHVVKNVTIVIEMNSIVYCMALRYFPSETKSDLITTTSNMKAATVELINRLLNL